MQAERTTINFQTSVVLIMNTKNNKRHQQTIETIERVFLSFLQSHELPQIRVCDICREAQINRSTFYANYCDVYDLAEQLKEKLFREVSLLWEQDFDYFSSERDFLKLFQHIKQNKELYRFYFKLGYDRSAMPMQHKMEALLKNADLPFLDYHISFFKNGFNAIVRQWLDRDCRETPEQMCSILLLEYKGRFKVI